VAKARLTPDAFVEGDRHPVVLQRQDGELKFQDIEGRVRFAKDLTFERFEFDALRVEDAARGIRGRVGLRGDRRDGDGPCEGLKARPVNQGREIDGHPSLVKTIGFRYVRCRC